MTSRLDAVRSRCVLACILALWASGAGSLVRAQPGSAQEWVLRGGEGDLLGAAVTAAGDIDGDGFDDVLVAAPGSTVAGDRLGHVFLFLGGPSGPATEPAWTFSSPAAWQPGLALASAGDVDGDGHPDVLVGAPGAPGDAPERGLVWLFRGTDAGLEATPSWTFAGEEDGARLGAAVAPAGDINGDGFDDVVIGAPNHTGVTGREQRGAAYVFLGGPMGLPERPDWQTRGLQPGAHLGTAVAGATDLNDDGFADVAVGAPDYSNTGGRSGVVRLWYGGPDGLHATSDVDLSPPSAGVRFGAALAPGADQNGDGYTDLVVGHPAVPDGVAIQPTSVYCGGPEGPRACGFDAGSSGAGLQGAFVAAGGDVNGDGRADYVHTDPVLGLVRLCLGGQGNAGTDCVAIAKPVALTPNAGLIATLAGDMNGDGFVDLVAGAPLDTVLGGPADAGVVFWIPGAAGLPVTRPMWEVDGSAAPEGFAGAVALVGDVDGDGPSEILVAAPYATASGEEHAGRVALYGPARGPAATPIWERDGSTAGERFGIAVAGAGDVDADGFADLLVTAADGEGDDSWPGRVLLLRGGPGAPSDEPAWSFSAPEGSGERLGAALAGGGDVDGDGRDDVLLGCPGWDHGSEDRGRALLFRGTETGLEPAPSWSAVGATAEAAFGASVAIGEVNGDGYADVVIGAPGTDSVSGSVSLYLGSPSGLGDRADWTATFSAGHLWGAAVAAVGDVDGDGFGDVVVGAPFPPQSIGAPGTFRVYGGAPFGIGSILAANVPAGPPGLGASVAALGDVNGDGLGDFAVGTRVTGDLSESGWFECGAQPGAIECGAPFPLPVGGGSMVAGGGDVDGDGRADLVVGHPSQASAPSTAGTVLARVGSSRAGSLPEPLVVEARDLEGGRRLIPGQHSASPVGFELHARGCPPAGRSDVRLEAQIVPLDQRFDGAPLRRSETAARCGPDETAAIVLPVDGLPPGVRWRWRARLSFASSAWPFAGHTRWVHGGRGGLADGTHIATARNDAPITRPDSLHTFAGLARSLDVLANDADPDGDAIRVVDVGAPGHGTATAVDERVVLYAPAAGFTGEDAFTYRIEDVYGGTATGTVLVSVRVHTADNGVIAVDDAFEGDEDSAIVLDVLANDFDLEGDPLSVRDVTSPSHGAVTVIGEGTLQYSPDADWNGTDVFRYLVVDGLGGSDSADVRVVVRAVDDPPELSPFTVLAEEDGEAYVDVGSHVADPDGDAVDVSVATPPRHGALLPDAAGSFRYRPAPDYWGEDDATFLLDDGAGEPVRAQVPFEVAPVPDAPWAADDELTVLRNQQGTVEVLANDGDPDGDTIRVVWVGATQHGVAGKTPTGIWYAPLGGWFGEDSFRYEIEDATGRRADAPVHVTIQFSNSTVVAADDYVRTEEGGMFIFDVLANDRDRDGDPLALEVLSGPAHGVAYPIEGELFYEPDMDFFGFDEVRYVASDPYGASGEATLHVEVAPMPDAPRPVADAFVVVEDIETALDVLSNDLEVDGEALAVIRTAGATLGTTSVTADGMVGYAPFPNRNGWDVFTYDVQDESGLVSTARVEVSLVAMNDPPEFVPPTPSGPLTATAGVAVAFDVLARDVDADPLRYFVSGLPAAARLEVTTGAFRWTPAPYDAGAWNATFEARDGMATARHDVAIVVVAELPGPDADVADSLDGLGGAEADAGDGSGGLDTAPDESTDSIRLDASKPDGASPFDGDTSPGGDASPGEAGSSGAGSSCSASPGAHSATGSLALLLLLAVWGLRLGVRRPVDPDASSSWPSPRPAHPTGLPIEEEGAERHDRRRRRPSDPYGDDDDVF